jgi:hypothetical protein
VFYAFLETRVVHLITQILLAVLITDNLHKQASVVSKEKRKVSRNITIKGVKQAVLIHINGPEQTWQGKCH